MHLFFKCPFARVFWFSSPLQLDVGTVEGGDFLQCWKGLCNKYGGEKESDQLLRWVVCGLWRIWKCRNSAVFEKVVCEPRVALDLLHQQWREIKDSRWDNEQHHCRQQVVEGETHRRWVKPPFCTIKVNCDGAWCKQTSRGGIGWVARNFSGIFQCAGGMGDLLCGSSLMAEAKAMRLALMACAEKGFEFV